MSSSSPTFIDKYVFAGFFRFTRSRRMRSFTNILKPQAGDSVIDVGGNEFNWQYVSAKLRVLLLNLFEAPITIESPIEFESVTGDGTDLPYEDGAFDIGFSNSVIEHLGTADRQRQFASEITRVSRQLWVQTPAREFFFEPHFLAPFVHWTPPKIRKRLVRWLSIWFWIKRVDVEDSNNLVDEIRLLNRREMQELFPDCRIKTERFLGMPKSHIAIRD